MPNDKVTKSLKEGESYKYLGVIGANEVMVNKRKDRMKKEYYRRVRKVLETKLNSENVFKCFNTWTVSVVTYSVAFLGWSRLQLEEIHRTRKLLTMNNGFHPKSNLDRLYLSRGEGGRELIGVQYTMEIAILGLRNYVRHGKERLLIAARTIEEDEDTETPNEYKKKKRMNGKHSGHKSNYMNNLQGKQRVKPVKIGGLRGWLKKGCLKRTTEALIMAPQEQAIRPKKTVNVECVKKLKRA